MDKKSQVLLIVVSIAILVSIGYMYKKYVIDKNFEIFQTESGVPDTSIEE